MTWERIAEIFKISNDYYLMGKGYNRYYTFDELKGLIVFHGIKTVIILSLLVVCMVLLIKTIRGKEKGEKIE